ncbi:MAG TPA: TonB family protein [Bryobacteraceae bacterium]|nr:TonB family protein [Bryobacteraceae bacterium]
MATLASPTGGYVWQDPGDSIMVQVSLDLVERLRAAVEQTVGDGPRGIEIGGLLLGRKIPGRAHAVSIDDFELVPCEHLRGASYTLSPGERHMLGARLGRRRVWQVVGFFRSHTRPGMYLDQDDFSIFSRYFQDDSQVFLLIRPSLAGPAMAGFFFWEDGDIDRRSPYRQFPFDAEQLAGGGFPIASVSGEWSRPPDVPRPALVPTPQPPEPAGRHLPVLSWFVVPLIAAVFLIAGIIVSLTRETQPAAPARGTPPLETLLPPGPQAAKSSPFAQPAPPPLPVAAPVEPHRRRRIMKAPPPLSVTAARLAVHVEPPPVLTPRPTTSQPELWTVLPAHTTPPPPPEADVSYEMPHPGVLRRAIHKLSSLGGSDSADGTVAPVPVHQVIPPNPPDADEDGAVDVKVSIDESGSVSRAQVLNRSGYLAAVSLRAARQWQFAPARKHDKPVPSEMILHFRFRGIM